MAKVTANNARVLINGYNLSTYATAFETESNVNPIDVTGFSDSRKNFIPGQLSGSIKADMLWSSTSGATHTALASLGSGNATILPEGGTTTGNLSISIPFTQSNYGAKGDPTSAIQVGTISFESYGDNNGVEYGNVLWHSSATSATITGTGFQVNAAPVTATCSGTLHVWISPASNTTVFKIQHCTTIDGTYADLVTFTIDGSTLTSERVEVASGTINQFVRVLATKSGTQQVGFTIHYWQSV